MHAIYILVLLFSIKAQAGILLQEIPDYLLQQNHSDLSQRALKKACTTSLALPTNIPCSPTSLVSIPEQNFFFANIYLSDNFDEIRTLEKLIDQDKDIELVEKLLDQDEPINTQISSSLNFMTNRMAVSVVPYRASIFSILRDPVNPRSATYGAVDREIRFQYAYPLYDSGWVIGANFKYLHREYVLDEFTLLDAIFDLDSVLQAQKFEAFYVEPAITYFMDSSWLPRLSLFVENASMKFKGDDPSFNDKAIINIGFGINPPVNLGFLDLNLNLSNNTNSAYDKEHILRLGGIYSLGLMNLTFGIDEFDSSLGIFSTLWSVRVGVLLEKRTLTNSIGEDIDDKSILTEFSYIF